MAKRTFDTTLAWADVDADTLTSEHRKAYDDYKAAYRLAKEARTAFEATMQSLAPEGKRIVMAYNFGKLSMAVDDVKAGTVAKGKVSLAAFLASQSASGVRA